MVCKWSRRGKKTVVYHELMILPQAEADAYIKEHFTNTLELAMQGKFTKTWYVIIEYADLFPYFNVYVILHRG